MQQQNKALSFSNLLLWLFHSPRLSLTICFILIHLRFRRSWVSTALTVPERWAWQKWRPDLSKAKPSYRNLLARIVKECQGRPTKALIAMKQRPRMDTLMVCDFTSSPVLQSWAFSWSLWTMYILETINSIELTQWIAQTILGTAIPKITE